MSNKNSDNCKKNIHIVSDTGNAETFRFERKQRVMAEKQKILPVSEEDFYSLI